MKYKNINKNKRLIDFEEIKILVLNNYVKNAPRFIKSKDKLEQQLLYEGEKNGV